MHEDLTSARRLHRLYMISIKAKQGNPMFLQNIHERISDDDIEFLLREIDMPKGHLPSDISWDGVTVISKATRKSMIIFVYWKMAISLALGLTTGWFACAQVWFG